MKKAGGSAVVLLFAALLVSGALTIGIWIWTASATVALLVGGSVLTAFAGAIVMYMRLFRLGQRLRQEQLSQRVYIHNSAGTIGRMASRESRTARGSSDASTAKKTAPARESTPPQTSQHHGGASHTVGGEQPSATARPGDGQRPSVGPATPRTSAAAETSEVGLWCVERELAFPSSRRLANRDFFREDSLPAPSSFRVGIVCDEFTYNSFRYEFNAVPLTPANWREKLASENLDILFIESAWQGIPIKERPWRGQVYASVKFRYENRANLLSLIQEAKHKGIPTVFWNKEDPTHFHDRVNDFVDTASRCDFIMTTAAECVSEYRKFMDADRIGCMPFAVQPRVFNPLGAGPRISEVAFAGSWYRVHKERAEIMRAIFDDILGQGVPLKIYDRYYGSETDYFLFPDEYREYTLPAVSHAETADIYRESLFGLNINTVTESETMFARRVFEMAACGVQIVSNVSAGMMHMFGETVIWAGARERDMNLRRPSDEIDAMRVSAMNYVLENHTYAHRFRSALDLMGIRYSDSERKTTIVACVSSEAEADRALAFFEKVRAVCSHLLIVVSEKVPSHLVQVYYRKYISRHVNVVSQEYARRYRVRPSTLLNTPTAFLMDVDEPVGASEISRALAHSAYTDIPISPERAPAEPAPKVIGDRNVLVKAVHVPSYIDGRLVSTSGLVV